MKKIFNVLLLLIFTFILSTSIPVLANETVKAEGEFDEFGIRNHNLIKNEFDPINPSDGWETIHSKNSVELNKKWTITFTGSTVSVDKIAGIVIEKDGSFLPVKIELHLNENKATIETVKDYLGDQSYTVRVFLENGLKYKMDFTTKSKHLNSLNYGNSTGNLLNGGIVAEDNDWIYYANSSENNTLYKINKSDSTKIKLSDLEWVSHINVLEGWIYFFSAQNEDSMGYIHRIRTDGTDLQKITTSNDIFRVSNNGWIYFKDMMPANNGNGYFKIKHDGTHRQIIMSDEYYYHTPIIENDYILYTFGDSTQLVLYNLINNSNSIITTDIHTIFNYILVDDWIYYQNGINKIYKMKLDGSDKSEVIDNVGIFNLNKDYIYFTNSDNYIYRMNMDGSNIQQLNSMPSHNINIINDWIYFEDQEWNYYRMGPDGSLLQEVN